MHKKAYMWAVGREKLKEGVVCVKASCEGCGIYFLEAGSSHPCNIVGESFYGKVSYFKEPCVNRPPGIHNLHMAPTRSPNSIRTFKLETSNDCLRKEI